MNDYNNNPNQGGGGESSATTHTLLILILIFIVGIFFWFFASDQLGQRNTDKEGASVELNLGGGGDESAPADSDPATAQ